MKPDERFILIAAFEAAPPSTLFPQKTIAAVLDCSLAKLERDRWEGVGVPYLKIGKAVRYRKNETTEYLDSKMKVMEGK